MLSLTVSVYQNLLKCRRLQNRKQNARWHRIWLWMRENGISLNFSFVSLRKSCRRHELGLPTLSAVVHLRKMMPRTMFWSIQTLCERQIYWMFPLFRARIDFLFPIFISWLMNRSWVPLFWLCLCTNSRLCCMHFSYHWHKICKSHIGWRKSLKGSATPAA